ncbi:hypothetical protein GCM10020218_066110 [Dactylosporangium vinaceum]|uniref:Uncharacterized protein n=1 Tax=Dactylosporangium vinaceum TaxID=53362 RepID=A0ABV5MTA7_9ACTN|nr:hypothetical protein [Dactylosporangium vinaceum]
MSEIVKGVLGGGWALLVGWIAPAAVNVVLAFWVLSGTRWLPGIGRLLGEGDIAGATLGVAVLVGLLLAAVQTPLYRILEGYLGWPHGVANRARERMRQRKLLLADRIAAVELVDRERAGDLDTDGAAALAAMRAHRRVRRHLDRDATGGAVRRGLLHERLRRFPVDDSQVVATRLGNAIRRLEEYGYDRYRLDTQIFWYELTAVADERTTKQVEQARTTVDFFVALLYGHLAVAGVALVGAFVHPGALLWAAVVGLPLLAYCWYRLAVVTTDEWAAAVRAMVNVGRVAFAERLGVTLPATLEEERTMWARQSRLVRLSYRDFSADDRPEPGIDAARDASAPAPGRPVTRSR